MYDEKMSSLLLKFLFYYALFQPLYVEIIMANNPKNTQQNVKV